MTTKYHKAFTMIELIFVIVIIGILASVALPKLSATRDDAQVSYVLASTKNLINDVYKYYTSQGNGHFNTATSQEVTDVPISNRTDCSRIGSGIRAFRTSTLYLCVNKIAILKITTGNLSDSAYSMTLIAFNESSHMGKILQNDKIFQSFTHGTSGREYIINTAKVNRD